MLSRKICFRTAFDCNQIEIQIWMRWWKWKGQDEHAHRIYRNVRTHPTIHKFTLDSGWWFWSVSCVYLIETARKRHTKRRETTPREERRKKCNNAELKHRNERRKKKIGTAPKYTEAHASHTQMHVMPKEWESDCLSPLILCARYLARIGLHPMSLRQKADSAEHHRSQAFSHTISLFICLVFAWLVGWFRNRFVLVRFEVSIESGLYLLFAVSQGKCPCACVFISILNWMYI